MKKVIVLVLFIAASSAEQAEKYFMPNFMANWFKAVEYCNYLGARLAVVASYEDQTELTEMVRKTDKYSHISTEFWIGANDLAEEGHFYWHATGTGLRYSNWKILQPDNAENVEHCVEVRYIPGHKWDWQWNDRDCKKMRYFACETSDVAKEVATF